MIHLYEFLTKQKITVGSEGETGEKLEDMYKHMLEEACTYAKKVDVSFVYRGTLYIELDALEPKDYPNGIKNNTISTVFFVDINTLKVELKNSGGHIYLSPADKATDKYRYYAMRSAVSIAEDYGIKKFRKQKYKSIKDCVNKMAAYFENVMDAVDKYTGGYPYKQGK